MRLAHENVEWHQLHIKYRVGRDRVLFNCGMQFLFIFFPEFCHNFDIPTFCRMLECFYVFFFLFLRAISFAIFICNEYNSMNPALAFTLKLYPSALLNEANARAFGDFIATTAACPLNNLTVTSPLTFSFTESLKALIESIAGSSHKAPEQRYRQCMSIVSFNSFSTFVETYFSRERWASIIV